MTPTTISHSSRPIRLRYGGSRGDTKVYIRWRSYSRLFWAHIGALVEASAADVGTVIEVVNHETGHLYGQYKRRVDGVSFLPERLTNAKRRLQKETAGAR